MLIVLVLVLVLWLPPGVRLLVTDTLGRTFRGYFASQLLFAVLIGFTTLIPFASSLTTLLVSGLLALNDPPMGLKVLAAITLGLQPATSPMPCSSRAREPQKRAALPTMLILSGFGPGQRRARLELCAAGVRSD